MVVTVDLIPTLCSASNRAPELTGTLCVCVCVFVAQKLLGGNPKESPTCTRHSGFIVFIRSCQLNQFFLDQNGPLGTEFRDPNEFGCVGHWLSLALHLSALETFELCWAKFVGWRLKEVRTYEAREPLVFLWY